MHTYICKWCLLGRLTVLHFLLFISNSEEARGLFISDRASFIISRVRSDSASSIFFSTVGSRWHRVVSANQTEGDEVSFAF